MHVSSTPFLLDSLCTDPPPPLPLRKIGEGALEGRGGLYTGYSWTTGLWHPASRAPRFWPTPERLCMNRGRSCWASDFKGLMWYRQSLHFSSSLKKTKGASACRVGLWEQECLFTMRKGRFYGSVNPRRAPPPPSPPPLSIFGQLSFCFANAPWWGRAFIQNSGGSRGGAGCSGPSIRPDACLRLKFLHQQDRISLFNWLVFFNKTRFAFCHKTKFQGYSKM